MPLRRKVLREERCRASPALGAGAKGRERAEAGSREVLRKGGVRSAKRKAVAQAGRHRWVPVEGGQVRCRNKIRDVSPCAQINDVAVVVFHERSPAWER